VSPARLSQRKFRPGFQFGSYSKEAGALATSAMGKGPCAKECKLGCSVQEVNGGDLSPRDEDDIDQGPPRHARTGWSCSSLVVPCPLGAGGNVVLR
jgi:hypothetical protein